MLRVKERNSVRYHSLATESILLQFKKAQELQDKWINAVSLNQMDFNEMRQMEMSRDASSSRDSSLEPDYTLAQPYKKWVDQDYGFNFFILVLKASIVVVNLQNMPPGTDEERKPIYSQI